MGRIMPQDERNVLDVLKAELNFLKKGGYSRSPREPWRAQLIFEDSPSCMNYNSKENPRPCAECVLMQFVLPERRGEESPCRHIPLTRDGVTLHELYRGGTQQEVEDAVADWLRGRACAKHRSDGLGAGGKDAGANGALEKTASGQDTEGRHVSQSSSEVRKPRMRFSV